MLQRKVRLYENLLRDVFHVLLALQDPARDCEHAVLMPFYQNLKRLFVAFLGAAHQLAFVGSGGGNAAHAGAAAAGVGFRYLCDACHGFPVTQSCRAGLPSGPRVDTNVSLRPLRVYACLGSYLYGIMPP